MRLWNISDSDIRQLYNSRPVVIKANSMVDLPDDTAVFLLGKGEIRGRGLVQIKEGDSKAERYAQGRLYVYNWNRQIYQDYEKHCEERSDIARKPVRPHEVVVQAKQIIDDYEKWIEDGKPFEDKTESLDGKKTVYACPHCPKEFTAKIAYFGHLRSHQKEKLINVNAGTTGNKSEGEGR